MCISYLSLIPIALTKRILSEQVNLRRIASQKYLIESLFPLQSANVWAGGEEGGTHLILKFLPIWASLELCIVLSHPQLLVQVKCIPVWKPLQFNTSLCFSHALVGTLRSLHCNSWGNSVRLSEIFDAAPWLPEGWELCSYSGVTMLGLGAALGAAGVYPCFLSLGGLSRIRSTIGAPSFQSPQSWLTPVTPSPARGPEHHSLSFSDSYWHLSSFCFQ